MVCSPLSRLVLLGSLLVGCGGGGSGTSNSNATEPPGDLSYEAEYLSLLAGEEVEPLVPQVEGKAQTWTITPDLPAGMHIDAGTGVIDGTPEGTYQRRTLVVEASNSAGSVTTSFDLRVSQPANFGYVTCADGTVNGLVIDALGGGLEHLGFAIDPEAGVTAEHAFVHSSGEFIYVPNLGNGEESSNISTFQVRENGRLEALEPRAIGIGPHDVGQRTGGGALYVSNHGSNDLYAYEVNQETGELTIFENGKLGVGNGPTSLAVDPGNQAVYVGNQDSTSISVVPLHPVSGAPIGIGLEFFLNNGDPGGLAVDHSGRILFVTLNNFDILVSLAINQASGQLTALDSIDTGLSPSAVTVHPDGEYVFVINDGDQSISSFKFDLLTGDFTQELQTLPLGGEPESITIEPAGNFGYVCCRETDRVIILDLRDRSAPKILGAKRTRSSPLSMGIVDGKVAVKKRARGLYALNSEDATINTFTAVPQNGQLEEVAAPTLVADGPVGLALDPYGRFLWAISSVEAALHTFQIGAEKGELFEVGSRLTTDPEPTDIAVGAAGRRLFVTSSATNSLSCYRIDPRDGRPEHWNSYPTGVDPREVSIDPTGQFLVTANHGDDTLSIFRFGAKGELLDTFLPVAAPGMPGGLRWNPAGDQLYVALESSDSVLVYDLDASNGLAPRPPGASASSSPQAFIAHPYLKRGYVALSGPSDGGVGIYNILEDGVPVFQSALTGVGLVPGDICSDPQGAFFYTSNYEGDNISRFALDESGSPIFLDMTPAGDGPLEIKILREVK